LRNLSNIKYDKNIFRTLLHEESEVGGIPYDMSINFGNPNSPINIIEVINPYCKHCALSHRIIENLLKEKDISVQLVFFVQESSDQLTNKLVKLLFALKEKDNTNNISTVLNDWFEQGIDDDEYLKEKYNIDENLLDKQQIRLDWMTSWCKRNNIQYTPSLFINHRLLPKIYKYKDIKFLFL